MNSLSQTRVETIWHRLCFIICSVKGSSTQAEFVFEHPRFFSVFILGGHHETLSLVRRALPNLLVSIGQIAGSPVDPHGRELPATIWRCQTPSCSAHPDIQCAQQPKPAQSDEELRTEWCADMRPSNPHSHCQPSDVIGPGGHHLQRNLWCPPRHFPFSEGPGLSPVHFGATRPESPRHPQTPRWGFR